MKLLGNIDNAKDVVHKEFVESLIDSKNFFKLRGWATEDCDTITDIGLFGVSSDHYHSGSNYPYGHGTMVNFGASSNGYGGLQIFTSNNRKEFKIRGKWGSWGDFITLATSDSNVASATKLETSRTLWGRSFNGTDNISGYLTNVSYIGRETGKGTYLYQGSIPTALGSLGSAIGIGCAVDQAGMYMWGHTNGSGYIQVGRSDGTATAYNLFVQTLGGNVAVGDVTPTKKLHVGGTFAATDLITAENGINCKGNLFISYGKVIYTYNSSGSGVGFLYPRTSDDYTILNYAPNGWIIRDSNSVEVARFNSSGGVTFKKKVSLSDGISGLTSDDINNALGYTPLDEESFTNASVKSVLGISDWALSASKPTYTKSDVGLGDVENTALSTWAGSSSIATLGTIKTGTWNGTAIGVAYGGTGKSTLTSGYALIGNGTSAVNLRAITNNTSATAVTASTNLITANTLYYHKGNSNIVTVGTITSGTWNGSKITNAYLEDSKITISGKEVSLGGSITQSALRTALGLGSNAYTSTEYLAKSSYTASDILTKMKTVDGTGSGLDADLLDGSEGSSYFKTNGYATEDCNSLSSVGVYAVSSAHYPSGSKYPYTYGTMVHFGVASSYASMQLFANYTCNEFKIRARWGTAWEDFYTIATTDSNVASATKLKTSRTIWGQSFDGTANITGDMTVADSFAINNASGTLVASNSSRNIGIRTSAVSGYNVKVSGSTYIDSSLGIGTGLTVGTSMTVGTTLSVSGAATFEGRINMMNGGLIYGANSSGTYQACFYPRFNDVTYLNYGTKGFKIRNNSSTEILTFGSDDVMTLNKNATLSGNVSVSGTLTAKGTMYISNNKVIYAYNSSGSAEGFLYPRTSDNYTIMNYGANGWIIRNNGSTEVARFNSSGGAKFSKYVGIGDTYSSSYKLYVGGNSYFSSDMIVNGEVTSYSARALKNVIDERGLTLEQLSIIKPTRFTWKDGRDSRIHIGGIADDVNKVLPEVVTKDENGLLTMNYSAAAFAIATSLIKPVNEHERKIRELENKNRELEKEIVELKKSFL